MQLDNRNLVIALVATPFGRLNDTASDGIRTSCRNLNPSGTFGMLQQISLTMPIIPQYKLIYFNGRGRAETIRLLFAQAQVKYEDVRIEKDQWPTLKESKLKFYQSLSIVIFCSMFSCLLCMPFGQLPVLEMDGKRLAQSHAIEKFLARMFGKHFQKFLKLNFPFIHISTKSLFDLNSSRTNALFKGLNGGDDWEAAKIDELILGLEDLFQKIVPWFKEQDEAKKIEIFKKLFDDEVTPFFRRYEQFLEKNGTGFFVGHDLSLADLAVFNMLSFFDSKLMPGHLKKYPHLDKFVHKIGELPNIKEWIEKRPRTDF
uniref:GST C-terminal domain-containing protein n=1 Tax=Ascaris lumbricoides TaxID=6252 RepID=A0A0M3HPS6_ASCLU